MCVCVLCFFNVNGNHNFGFFCKCYGLWSKLHCENSVTLTCSQCCVCFNLLRNTVSLIYTRMWCKSREISKWMYFSCILYPNSPSFFPYNNLCLFCIQLKVCTFVANTLYRCADKSLTRPGRKQARKHVRDARDFNNIDRELSPVLFSCKARRRRKFRPFWQKH